MKNKAILKAFLIVVLVILSLVIVCVGFLYFFNKSIPATEEAPAITFDRVLIADRGDAVIGLYTEGGQLALMERNVDTQSQTNSYILFENWGGDFLFSYQDEGIVFASRNTGGFLEITYHQPYRPPRSLSSGQYILEGGLQSQVFVRQDTIAFTGKDAGGNAVIGLVQDGQITVENLTDQPLFSAGIRHITIPPGYSECPVPYAKIELDSGAVWYMGLFLENGEFPFILSAGNEETDIQELGYLLYPSDRYILLEKDSGVILTHWHDDTKDGNSSSAGSQSNDTPVVLSAPGDFSEPPRVYNLRENYGLVVGKTTNSNEPFMGYIYNTATHSSAQALNSLLNANAGKGGLQIEIYPSKDSIYFYDGYTAYCIPLDGGESAAIEVEDYGTYTEQVNETGFLEAFSHFVRSAEGITYFTLLALMIVLSAAVMLLARIVKIKLL